MRLNKRLGGLIAGAALVAVGVAALPSHAQAWWGYRGGVRVWFPVPVPHLVVRPPVVYAPPVYAPPVYAPPPVAYVAPPPVYYAQPRWVPPHWQGPYWVPGHWA
jgi:hypothetical protein